MPAASYNTASATAAATIVNTMVAMDATITETLAAEDALLVQSCTRAGASERLQEVNDAGDLVLDVHYNHRLTYAVQASVLEWSGLADYHPGRALSDQGLEFANGLQAMQFEGTGTLIYLDPQQVIGAGDLPTVQFTIERLFVDLDEATYPKNGGLTVTYLPAQGVTEVAATAYEAVLEDIFQAAGNIGGNLTATLYNGNPASGGTSVSGAVACDPWPDSSVIQVSDDEARITCSAITFPSTGSSRTVTHIRFQRGSLVVADVALAVTLTLAANSELRVLADDITVSLTWTHAGEGGVTPSRLALAYLFDADSTLLSTAPADFTIEVYASASELNVPLTTIQVPRSVSDWEMPTSDSVRNANAITGTELAPEGGWPVSILHVTWPGLGSWWLRLERFITVAAGQPVTIPAEVMTLTVG